MLPNCFEFWKQEHHKGSHEEREIGPCGVGQEGPQKPGRLAPTLGRKTTAVLQGAMFLQRHRRRRPFPVQT